MERKYTGLSVDLENWIIKLMDNTPEVRIKYHQTRYHKYHVDRNDPSAYSLIFGFCGKLYLLFICNCNNKNYTFNDVIAFKNKYDTCESNDGRYIVMDDTRSLFYTLPFNIESIEQWKNTYHIFEKIDDIFVALNCPVFCIFPRSKKLIINPILKDFGMQSVFDPYTTYQEIDMYLNNVLTNRHAPDIIRTDDLIRDSKGMDKWSFRQIGPKKRKV
jgi:hypothetical protein